jgi:hypothetical protein
MRQEKTDEDKAKGIIEALRYCKERVSYTSVAKQFYIETRRTLSKEDYERAIKKGI